MTDLLHEELPENGRKIQKSLSNSQLFSAKQLPELIGANEEEKLPNAIEVESGSFSAAMAAV